MFMCTLAVTILRVVVYVFGVWGVKNAKPHGVPAANEKRAVNNVHQPDNLHEASP